MDKDCTEATTIGRKIADSLHANLDGMVRLAAPASAVQLQEAERLLLMPLPQELASLLQHCNGIEELMLLRGEQIPIDFILYPLDEIVQCTQFYRQQCHKTGIFFAGDGAGDPYYLTENGAVLYFHPIVDEEETVAASLTEFYQNAYPPQKPCPPIPRTPESSK